MDIPYKAKMWHCSNWLPLESKYFLERTKVELISFPNILKNVFDNSDFNLIDEDKITKQKKPATKNPLNSFERFTQNPNCKYLEIQIWFRTQKTVFFILQSKLFLLLAVAHAR